MAIHYQMTAEAVGTALVVIADDEPDLVMILQLKLERAGLTTVVATHGPAAKALIRSHHPDLAILDVSMPGRTGLEVVRNLRADAVDVPVVALSARAGQDDIEAGIDAGFTSYVTKPFSPGRLLEDITELIESRRVMSPERESSL